LRYLNPKTIDDALASLSNQKCILLSGGTDFYPGLRDQPPSGNILDMSGLPGFREIKQLDDGSWSIGATATWTDIIRSHLPSAFDGLKLAAKEGGSVQIQNRATVVGNICNASPAADGVPPLLTLDAVIATASLSGKRRIPLSDFILGNRKTALKEDELGTAIVIPAPAAEGVADFIKLGARKYLVISISMVASRLTLDPQNTILNAAISVGSCSLVARRLTSLEEALVGQPLCAETGDLVNAKHLDVLSPIDDVRATAGYRLDASLELVRRSITNFPMSGQKGS